MRGQGHPETRDLNAQNLWGVLVASRFNQDLVDKLVHGAQEAFWRMGGEHLRLVRVAGALEIPLAIQSVARRHRLDFAVALGCVIRGQTSHYDLVINESLRHCMNLSLSAGLPIGHGILTVENHEQALERCGGKYGNKGEEALHAAVELALIQKGQFIERLKPL